MKGEKDKYPVNVAFEVKDETDIRKAAEGMGVDVETFIKIAVKEYIWMLKESRIVR